MPLPAPDVSRKPIHTRRITVNAFARDDGQWDLEAELIDVKAYDYPVRDGSIHQAGDPVHHIHLRVTFDDSYTITASQAAYDAAPYGEHCMRITSDYQDLVGLNLLRRFRDAVRKRFGRRAGCTHLTELSYVLPTAAIQALVGQRREQSASDEASTGQTRPFQIDGCHALRADGGVVKEHYPKWYASPTGSPSSNTQTDNQ